MLIDSDGSVYCPLCKSFFSGSEYLNSVFYPDIKPLFLANLVCHYRHNHIAYYNRWVHYHSRFRDYETFKTTVNNRAKRNILRKCKKLLRENHFTVQDFEALQHTDDKTLKLAVKILGGRTSPKTYNGTTLDMFLEP